MFLLFAAEVCHALNVTVTPGPVVMATERDNLTLSCLVSQRKRSNSVLILRWFYSPITTPQDSSLSPSAQNPNQFLIAKLGIKKIKLYGNYTRRFPRPKFRLLEEREGEVFRLWMFNVTGVDQGLYSCRVQEIRKLRDTWRASSNGTSGTQLMGEHLTHFAFIVYDESLWVQMRDNRDLLTDNVYLCAVLICSLGLLSIFLFTLVLTCQYFYRRHSSGETVTSSSSSSSSSPKAQRKDTRPKIPARTITPPKLPSEPPPHTPNKGKIYCCLIQHCTALLLYAKVIKCRFWFRRTGIFSAALASEGGGVTSVFFWMRFPAPCDADRGT
uniref:V-set and transmembrane domain containing 4a n=1 Tax=Neogobius melanostomus TaxID=47308 RepID=A0A8C6TUW2_9GOBI